MNCKEFNELLFSYIEGELDDSQKKLFEEHMKTCSSCEKEYKAYQKMINDIHALPMEELPKGYCKKLHGKLEDAQISKIRKKRNNYIKYIGIAASCVLVISAIYFAGDNFNGFNQSKMNDSASDYGINKDYASTTDNADIKAESGAQENENYTIAQDKTADTNNIMAKQRSMFSMQDMESKIIKSGSLDVQTLDFDKFVEQLNQVVRDNNGYFELNETSVRYKTEDKEYKDANIKLRVPQESFYDIVNFIESQADVYNQNVNETDVSKEYYDTQNSLTNLQVQEQRLRELYDKAENIADILAIENEIRRVRTEIDTYSIDLSNIDDRVNMATISLTITEIEGKNINMPSSQGLWGKSKEGFVRTVNNIIDFIENIIVWIISYLPVIIPLLIIGFIIYRVIKKRNLK